MTWEGQGGEKESLQAGLQRCMGVPLGVWEVPRLSGTGTRSYLKLETPVHVCGLGQELGVSSGDFKKGEGAGLNNFTPRV